MLRCLPLLMLLCPLCAMAQDDVAPTVRAVLSDSHGNPLPEEVQLGELLVFSARKSVHGDKPRSVLWEIEPEERASRAVASDDGLTYYVSTGLKPVTITVRLTCALGDEAATTKISVRCGHGPQPPPDPTPPDPPKPKPPTPTAKTLKLTVVHDAKNITADTAIVLNSVAWWNGLKVKGHDFIFYSHVDQTAFGKLYVAESKASGVPLPTLTIEDAATAKNLDIVALPKTTEEIDSLVKKHTGAK